RCAADRAHSHSMARSAAAPAGRMERRGAPPAGRFSLFGVTKPDIGARVELPVIRVLGAFPRAIGGVARAAQPVGVHGEERLLARDRDEAVVDGGFGRVEGEIL